MSEAWTKGPVLVADVGGTHVRFALADTGAAEPLIAESARRYRAAEFASFGAAVERYLDDCGCRPSALVIAAAGVRVGDEVRLTNNVPWVISRTAVEREFGFGAVALLNDFAAMALSVSLLQPHDLRAVGAPPPVRFDVRREQTFAILGPGTGLGVGALVVREGRAHPLETEGGHASFAPDDEDEVEIYRRLAARFGRVSRERVLCGSGLVNLYEIVCEIDGVAPRFASPEDITAAAGDDPACRRTIERFCEQLGAFAGDLALTFGAWDGVYVTGGLVQPLLPWIERSGFRRRFENKGRLSSVVARVPASIVLHVDAGLLGAAAHAIIASGRFAR
ncbi:MAG TPA: glucokinase [Rhodanobacteraceae bacterium]|nr:glucokinase [Rhodanobacteraceae bacterium]